MAEFERATDFESLVHLFHKSSDSLGEFTPVEADDLPTGYQSLLAHHDHMTVTVEAWHNSLVDVRVLREELQAESYAREILLARRSDGVVVQYGIVRIDLAQLPEVVREEIHSQALPLGRILIRHHVLREVELLQLWRVKPAESLRLSMNLSGEMPIYGRSARIQVNGKPAIELLEIVSE